MKRTKGTLLDALALGISTSGWSFLLPERVLLKRGSGFGTLGALVALPPLALGLWLGAGVWFPLALTVVSFVAGMLAVGRGEKELLRRNGGEPLKRHTGEQVWSDFNQTNVDEFHGMTLSAVPVFVFGWPAPFLWLAVAFALFRLFDAKKPSIIGTAERRFAGSVFGIMIDDTVAAVFAAADTCLAAAILTRLHF